MKRSLIIKSVILLLTSLVTIFNIYLLQIKDSRNLISYNALLQTTNLISGTAFGENFPEDPMNGENLGEDKYKLRAESQYYLYEYSNLHYTLNGEQMYAEYQIPITKVSCTGIGGIACYKGTYFGERTYLGEVAESKKK